MPLLLTTLAGAMAVLPATARTEPAPAAVVEELAVGEVAATPPPPLFLGVAQVVVRPGARTESAGTRGPRLLAVEAGLLAVRTGGPGRVVRSPGGGGWGGPEEIVAETDLVLGPGDRLILETGALRTVSNDGARPAVYLDAALFPAGPEPVAAAFTTEEGVSFQLLTGVVAETVPSGPVAFALVRVRVPPGGALPATPRAGPAIAYVESGSLALTATAGDVRFGRAAAPAPTSTAGPLRPVAVGEGATVSAGSSLFLATGAAVAAGNARGVPASLLMVEVRPDDGGSTPTAGNASGMP